MNAVPRRIRVMFVDLGGNAGGSTRSLHSLIGALDPQKFESVLLFGDRATDLEWSAHSVVQTRFVGFHNYSFFPFAFRWTWLLQALRFLVRLPLDIFRCFTAFRRCHADVVHVNGGQIIAAGIAGRLARIPVVWHIRELVEQNVFGHFQALVYEACAERILCVSHAVADRLPTMAGKVLVVANPVDEPSVDPGRLAEFREQRSLAESDFVILLLGRWLVPVKGYNFLADVADGLKGYPHIRFLLAGEARRMRGLEMYHRDAKRIYDRWEHLVSAGSARFIGLTDPVIAIGASNVVVCPNTAPEPFGRTVIEANLQGKPVLASRIEAFDETIIDGVTGWLLPLSVDAWIAQIVALVENPAKLATTGDAALHRSKRYLPPAVSGAVEQTYAGVFRAGGR